MRVFLASEYRCVIYKNKFYLETRAYSIYERYYKEFGDIVMCSRFKEVNNIPFDCLEARFIKEIVDCKSLVNTMIGIYKDDILESMKKCDLVIGRFPSIIAFRSYDYAKKLNKVFLAELMCDGWDSYWNHSFLGKFIAPYMNKKMKICTWESDFAVYVTEQFLQKKYPCKNYSIHASNVVINSIDNRILNKRLEKIKNTNIFNISIMTSANVDQRSKGQEYVVKAIKDLKNKGINISYYLVGGGDVNYLLNLAKKLNISENIFFMGRISLEKVFEKLDDIDIYIHPSLQEGLPRAVIEALSRACPVLGAKTAGIPELIDSECVFKRASSISIVNAIDIMLNNGLENYAIRNFEKSKNYYYKTLDIRRIEYYKKVKLAIFK